MDRRTSPAGNPIDPGLSVAPRPQVVTMADEMDRPLSKIGRFTASDVNVVPLGVPALDGLGPVGHRTRTAGEYVEVPTLVERAVLLALYLRGLALENKGNNSKG